MQIKNYLLTKFWRPLLGYLKSGLSPEKLAITVALGIVLGIIPIIGSTTLLTSLAAILFRLNMAVIQLVNFVIYPLQLILFIPFIKIGTYYFDGAPIPTMETLLEDPWHSIQHFWFSNLLGLGVWAIIVPPILALVYFVLVKLLSKQLVSQRSE